MTDLEWNKYVQKIAKTVPNPIKDISGRKVKIMPAKRVLINGK